MPWDKKPYLRVRVRNITFVFIRRRLSVLHVTGPFNFPSSSHCPTNGANLTVVKSVDIRRDSKKLRSFVSITHSRRIKLSAALNYWDPIFVLFNVSVGMTASLAYWRVHSRSPSGRFREGPGQRSSKSVFPQFFQKNRAREKKFPTKSIRYGIFGRKGSYQIFCVSEREEVTTRQCSRSGRSNVVKTTRSVSHTYTSPV